MLNVYGANQTPEDAALHDPSIGAQAISGASSYPLATRGSIAFYSYLVVNFYIAMEYIAMENGIIMGELWVNHGLIFKFDSFDNI